MIVLFHAMMTDTENKAVVYGVKSSHLQGVKQSFTECISGRCKMGNVFNQQKCQALVRAVPKLGTIVGTDYQDQ